MIAVLPRLCVAVEPVIELVGKPELRNALSRALQEEIDSVRSIEECFDLLPRARWSRDLLCTLLASWKATHLKMLAIYGLSCRLHRQAEDAQPAQRAAFYLAAARNAATSHEDLGLDYDGHTHSELYDDFAGALVGDDSWQLRNFRLPEASQFSRWVYRNMVVEEIEDGLLTNMFSEIYNHGEYSIALPAFAAYLASHSALSAPQQEKALAYIQAHVTDDTEADHFMVVVEALDRYCDAAGRNFDRSRAEGIFRVYLRNLAPVMRGLAQRMADEWSAGSGGKTSGRVEYAS